MGGKIMRGEDAMDASSITEKCSPGWAGQEEKDRNMCKYRPREGKLPLNPDWWWGICRRITDTKESKMPKDGVCLLIFHTLNMHLSEPLSVVWHVELISSYRWEIRGFLSVLTIPVREFQINFSERERGGYQMTAVILLWEFPVNWLLMSFLQKQLDISHARHKTIGIMPHWCRATISHYISDKCDCFAPH